MNKLDVSVLYAEDAEIIRKAGADIILSKVHTLYLANDGDVGLELFKKHLPEIVITDIGMPKMDGLTMARAIKTIKPETKIIITTAHDDSKYLIDSIEIGVDRYLLKSALKVQLPLAVQRCYDIILAEKRSKAESDFILTLSKTLIEESPTVVLVTNVSGYIEFVNRKFSDATGFSAEEVISRKPNILKSEKNSPEFYSNLWTTIKSGKKWSGKFINKKKNGELFEDYSVIFPIKDLNGEINYYVKSSINSVEFPEFGKTVHSEESSKENNFYGIEINPSDSEKIEELKGLLKRFCSENSISNIISNIKTKHL